MCKPERGSCILYIHSPLLKYKEWHENIPNQDTMVFKILEDLVEEEWVMSDSLTYDAKYVFKSDLVRIFRNTGIAHENKFHLYYPDKLMSIIHKKKTEEIRIDTLYYDWKVNPDWEVKYKVVEKKENKKMILGHHCTYYKLIENKSSKYKSTRFQYEFYTAPKIKFPAELSCSLYADLIDECPLEIIVTDLDYPQYYSKIVARKVEKQINDKDFTLPSKFKN